MTRLAVSVLVFVAMPIVAAAGVNEMYPQRQLDQDAPRYERRDRQLLSQGLWAFLNGAEKQALAGLRLDLPGKGDSPLDVYSIAKRGQPTVVFPILSLKFIEDLSVAYAWRHVNRHSLEPIDEYVAMLKYRRPQDFPGGRVPDPLTALGVPPRIWERDKRVDDLSLRFRNTAWAFILVHELGHLRFRHAGNRAVSPEVSQRQEIEADAFAVDLLSRSDTIPMGMILWFQATVGFLPNRADFETEAAYTRWVQGRTSHPRWGKATHPVNPERLRRLGVALNRPPKRA